MTPLTIIRKVKTWLNREVQIYNRHSGICQECGLPLDGFEWVIHKGKYEDYPVHLYCKGQIEYEDSMKIL